MNFWSQWDVVVTWERTERWFAVSHVTSTFSLRWGRFPSSKLCISLYAVLSFRGAIVFCDISNKIWFRKGKALKAGSDFV